MTWDPITQPVDDFSLGGYLSPGIANLRDGTLTNKVDKKAPTGHSGAVTVMHGRELGKITATIKLLEVQDFVDWETFRRVVDETPGGTKPKALELVHPIAADLGITAVIVKGRTQLKQDEVGTWTVDIFFEEYRKPAPKRARPSGSASNKKKKNPEEDELDRQLREARERAQDEARK